MEGFPLFFEKTDDLTNNHIYHLLERTQFFKSTPPLNPLIFKDNQINKNFTLITFFEEHSTRTKYSFIQAANKLGIHHIDFDLSSSSFQKGESLEETLYTLKCQDASVIAYRVKNENTFRELNFYPDLGFINGGNGKEFHPTQALLDLFTINNLLGSVEGKTIGFIGDCAHARTCSSLTQLLKRMKAKVVWCGPEELAPQKNSFAIEVEKNRENFLKEVDLVYSLRIQKERHQNLELDLNHYISNYRINGEILDKYNKPLLHPGPVNIGFELCETALQHTQYKGYEQVQNGVFMRMSVIEAMINDNLSTILNRDIKKEPQHERINRISTF